MEIAGKEDLAGSGLTISKSGVRKIHLLVRIAQERNKWIQVVKCLFDTYMGFLPMDHDDDHDYDTSQLTAYLPP